MVNVGQAFLVAFYAALATIASSLAVQFVPKNFIYYVKNIPLVILVSGYAILDHKLSDSDATAGSKKKDQFPKKFQFLPFFLFA